MSAVVSYENTTAEVEYSTGIKISKSAQQKLIHRSIFDLPQTKSVVEELNIDGENIRMRVRHS
jgi:hypothetical protein